MKKEIIFKLFIIVIAFGGIWYWLSTQKDVQNNVTESLVSNEVTTSPVDNIPNKDETTKKEEKPKVINIPVATSPVNNIPIVKNNNQDTSEMSLLKTAFSKKYNKSYDSVAVVIDSTSGAFIKGSVDFDNSGNPAIFYAYNKGDLAVIVAVENGMVACSSIVGYAFPNSMIDQCYNSSVGSVVNR